MSVGLRLICHTGAVCILGAKQTCGRLANQKMFHVNSMLCRVKNLEDKFVCPAGLNSCHVDRCNYSRGYRPDIQPSRLHLGLSMCNQHCHVFTAHTSIEGQHR